MARKKPATIEAADVARRTFVLTKDGGVFLLRDGKKQDITEKQVEESVGWTNEGSQTWAEKGARYLPKPRLIPWKCDHHLCINRIRNPGTCPWFVDSAFRVWCGAMDSRYYGPAIYSGDSGNPPMVLEHTSKVAYRPLTLFREQPK